MARLAAMGLQEHISVSISMTMDSIRHIFQGPPPGSPPRPPGIPGDPLGTTGDRQRAPKDPPRTPKEPPRDPGPPGGPPGTRPGTSRGCSRSLRRTAHAGKAKAVVSSLQPTASSTQTGPAECAGRWNVALANLALAY